LDDYHGGIRPPRIAISTHDAYGLGHVRRSLRIIRALARQVPESAILLLTGSPAHEVLKSLPRNADYVKIPTVVTSGAEGAKPPMLPIGLAELTLLREQLILQALRAFVPDVLLVDNFPLGSQRELLASIHELRRHSTRLVLGVRDILDPPERVRNDWSRQGMYEILDRFYDSILVYGTRDVLDVAEAYALPSRIARKVRYCGYVTEASSAICPEAEVRAELRLDGPFILGTAGGGGDGFPLLKVFLESLPLIPGVSAVVTTGQFMGPDEQAELRRMAAEWPGVVVLEHLRDLPSCMAAAELVVAMGGYNTTAEILTVGTRAVIVPRTWRSGEHQLRANPKAGVDAEQKMRAEALARLRLVDTLDARSLTPEELAACIRASLARPKPATNGAIDLHGVERVADILLSLADGTTGDSRR